MEPEQQPQTSSPSKLVIILLILIVSAGGYLVYAIYNESTKNSSETTTESTPETTTTPSVDTTTDSTTSEPASTSEMMDSNYTLAEVEENRTPASCWTIINGSVYNITSYIPNHPGGPAEISQICGRDGSELFAKPAQHASGGAKDVLSQFEIGKLVQ